MRSLLHLCWFMAAQSTTLHIQEWGEGEPLIALHPLALESTAFAGVAQVLARRGIRTLAADLPGFGVTPGLDAPLTPRRLAKPVIELARSLERPPLLLGFSMGGRVALEAALVDPGAFRAVVLVAPYLPWLRHRPALRLAGLLDPAWGERLPLERIWPVLKRMTAAVESIEALEHDWLARASVRVVYYSSCSATRLSFLSAARELALDPAFGPDGLWTRLPQLKLPASFLWTGRDKLIPAGHAAEVSRLLPRAPWLEVPCSGHFVNFRHFRCMEHAMAMAVDSARELADGRRGPDEATGPSLAPCLAATERVTTPASQAAA